MVRISLLFGVLATRRQRIVAGQLGDNTTTSRNAPIAVRGLPSDFDGTAIAAGPYHAVRIGREGNSRDDVFSLVRRWVDVKHYRRRLVLVSLWIRLWIQLFILTLESYFLGARIHPVCSLAVVERLLLLTTITGQLGDGTIINRFTAVATRTSIGGPQLTGLSVRVRIVASAPDRCLCARDRRHIDRRQRIPHGLGIAKSLPLSFSRTSVVFQCAIASNGTLWCWCVSRPRDRRRSFVSNFASKHRTGAVVATVVSKR